VQTPVRLNLNSSSNVQESPSGGTILYIIYEYLLPFT
jgi:hypothetical protein